MNIPQDLIAGTILLYSTKDIVDNVIEWKESDDVAHVEVYAGNGKSWASRNGVGVGLYDFRPDGLKYVRQLNAPFNDARALNWFDVVNGAPYGWKDIEASAGLSEPNEITVNPQVLKKTGMDCSHFAAALLEVGFCPQFDPSFPKNKITPSDFKKVLESKQVYP